jgi:hypothetical protein
MTGPRGDGPVGLPTPPELPTPAELHKVTESLEAARARKALEEAAQRRRHEQELQRRFEDVTIGPEAVTWLESRLRRAAEMGATEIQTIRFPARFLPDHGRAINNDEPDWPASLTGFPRRAYDYFARELQPKGYRLSARILDYPDGMPGHVGFFLSW